MRRGNYLDFFLMRSFYGQYCNDQHHCWIFLFWHTIKLKFSFLLLNLILTNKINISHLNDELYKVPWYLKNQSVFHCCLICNLKNNVRGINDPLYCSFLYRINLHNISKLVTLSKKKNTRTHISNYFVVV